MIETTSYWLSREDRILAGIGRQIRIGLRIGAAWLTSCSAITEAPHQGASKIEGILGRPVTEALFDSGAFGSFCQNIKLGYLAG